MNNMVRSHENSDESFDVDEYFTLMKKMTAISVKSDWEAMVKAHLSTAKKMYDIVDTTPIDNNSIDLSNVFRAGNIHD